MPHKLPAGLVQLTTAFPSSAPPPASNPSWQWTTLGSPPGKLLPLGVVQAQGVTTVLVAQPDNPYVFYGATPGATPQQWSWTLLATGNDQVTYTPVGVLQTGANAEVGNVFLLGSDQVLYCLQSDPNGTGWQWATLPQPAHPLVQTAGALPINDTPTAFFTSADNCLCLLSCSSAGSWSWVYSGPQATSLRLPLGTMLIGDAYVTLIWGEDGNLYQSNYIPDSIVWNWDIFLSSGLPLPSAASLIAPAGTVVAGTTPNFLALGSDGQLWTFWSNKDWYSLALFAPEGVKFIAPLGTLTAGTSPNVLLLGSDGQVWSCWYKQYEGWSIFSLPVPGPAGQFSILAGTRQTGSVPGVFLQNAVTNQLGGFQYYVP